MSESGQNHQLTQSSLPFAWRQTGNPPDNLPDRFLIILQSGQDRNYIVAGVLAFQKGARDAMNSQLATLNLPSRDDVARLGELILGLEEKVDQLDDRVAALSGKPKPASSARPKAAPRRKRHS